jgi:hypothetical protein
MVFHFNTQAEAVAHLLARGFTRKSTADSVWRKGTIRAAVHPCRNGVVAVSLWEV